ncbi:MAG: cell division protein FtsL [Holophagales bacterium]|jgi:hypothetical protein|nr:cell division protein FtsL [Holophagales bacterium]
MAKQKTLKEEKLDKKYFGADAREVREFFNVAVNEYGGHLEKHFGEHFEPEIGRVGKNDFGMTHPEREDEVVISEEIEGKWIFSPSFVKECFEASKLSGENELLNYLYECFAIA